MVGTGGGSPLGAAVARLQEGDYAAARPLLEAAVLAAPGDTVAHAYLGMTLFHLQDVDGAKWHLDHAVGLDPREFLAWAKRGEYWLHLACYPQAAADLKRAMGLPAPTVASRRRVAYLLQEVRQGGKASFVRTAVAPSFGPLGAWLGGLGRRLRPRPLGAPAGAPRPEGAG
jgi:tetratricopeptide (TPR) repeat protein